MQALGLPNNFIVTVNQVIGDNFTSANNGNDAFNDVESTPAVSTPSTSGAADWVSAATGNLSDAWIGTDLFQMRDAGTNTIGLQEYVQVVNRIRTVTGFTESTATVNNFNNSDAGNAADTETGSYNAQPEQVSEGYSDGSQGTDNTNVVYQGTPANYTAVVTDTDNATM